MSEPPKIVRYREPRSRISEENRQIKDKGRPPSKDWMNYTPNIHESAMLFNLTSGRNYRKEAKQKRNAALKEYYGESYTPKSTMGMLFQEMAKQEMAKQENTKQENTKEDKAKEENTAVVKGGKRKTMKRRMRKNTTARRNRH